jgi:hypothetical protein
VTPGRTAPDGSFTTPVIAAWAKTTFGASHINNAAARTRHAADTNPRNPWVERRSDITPPDTRT